jgi:hypothetical protein
VNEPETEETQAPAPDSPKHSALARDLRVMAVVRWVLLALVLGVAATTWWVYVLRPTTAALGPDKYYCPMHPQIRSAVPGTCPICFMNLEPIPDERKGTPKPAVPTAPQPGEAAPGLSKVMLSVERRETVGITTIKAERRSVARELRLPAVLEAPENSISEVRVRTPGFVERVARVETGGRVGASEPLAWLYSPEVLEAEEEMLAALRMRPPQGTDASKDHDLGAQVREAAQSRLALLGVGATDIDRIAESGKPERLLPVRAPRGGVVTERSVVQGTYATPEMRLFQISDLSKLWVEATVAPEDLESVSRAKSGKFVSRAQGAAREVKFLLVEPRVSAATRAARVRFGLDNRDGAHRPDDIGEVTVELAAEELVLVPRDAVIDVGATRYVYVEREAGLFEPVVVETGPLVGEERAILRGLDAGMSVVARGGFLLDSESRLGAALAPTAAPSASAVPPTSAAPSAPAPSAPAAPDHGHDHDHGGHP